MCPNGVSGFGFRDPDSSPTSFYMLRVVHKPPCIVLRLAFLGGTSGQQRYKVSRNTLCYTAYTAQIPYIRTQTINQNSHRAANTKLSQSITYTLLLSLDHENPTKLNIVSILASTEYILLL